MTFNFEGTMDTVLNDFSDEEVLIMFNNLVETRLALETRFLAEEDSDIITHQVLTVSCGDMAVISDPAELEFPVQAVINTGITVQ